MPLYPQVTSLIWSADVQAPAWEPNAQDQVALMLLLAKWPGSLSGYKVCLGSAPAGVARRPDHTTTQQLQAEGRVCNASSWQPRLVKVPDLTPKLGTSHVGS